MQIISKPDYSFIVPEKTFSDIKIFFLSKHLGIHPDEIKSDYPAPPPISTLNKISSYFPVTPKNIIFLNQIHSDLVIKKLDKRPSFSKADGIITSIKGLALAIKTADCLPIFLFDSNKKIISAIHAGWRGTALKIVKKAIKKLKQDFNCKPADIYAFLGPAINGNCYEVGKDVFEYFNFLGKKKYDFFNKSKSKKFFMDLKGINIYLMEEEGILSENIEVCDLCTHCEKELFYSYRRDGLNAGRNISFILLT